MTKEDKGIIQGVVASLNEDMIYEFKVPVRLIEPVDQPKYTWWDKLLRKPLPDVVEPETERTFKVYESVVSNQYRIASKALSLPDDLYEDETQMLSYVPEHLPTMIYIIAAAVQNNYKEPEQELITFFERNLTNSMITQHLTGSLLATNMQGFLTSIVLMNGMAKILEPKASPQDGSE